MLDYHLHLWPHTQADAEATIDQVAAYCEHAMAHGVTEIALTEHLFRFTQAKDRLGGFWDDLPGAALRPGMAAYWDHHARVDLDSYVEVVQAVKATGLPVVLGLEVDYYRDRMDDVADLLDGYPFDVLIGSVHWIDTWRFDVLDDPLVMAEWDVRDIDAVWDAYSTAMEELGASGVCDVFAHPDLVKIAGRIPADPAPFYDRMAEAAVASGMAAEVSSAGWRKPIGEEYPAPPLLRRYLDQGVPLTTASDAHTLPDVAHRSGDLRALLGAAGVSSLQGYRDRVPYSVPVGPAGATGETADAGGRGGGGAGGWAGPPPAELALDRTGLDDVQLAHLLRLLGTWGVLADLSFSDLVLLAPISESYPGPASSLVILGQMRPSNSATVIEHDLVGQTAGVDDWPLVTACFQTGEVTRGEMRIEPGDEPVRLQCIPVRCDGEVVAVMARLAAGAGRRPGHLERTYRDVFDRFAVMLAESTFPFPGEEVATEEAPRVGDGIVLVDEEGRVRYASPNATNALHRMGMYSQLEGRRLYDLGVEESAIEWALASALPVVEEVERRPDVIVLLHCIPLLAQGDVTGCLVLLRDVTDVRRLDRLLLSKDAAIREVHHRVKNNLQTISALLRLQARRLPPGVGRVALFEAERRVRSIAIVHEILSRDPSDQVPFDEIVTSLIKMAEDSVVSSVTLTFTVVGELGEVPADVATPLAVVLAELLQNAVEHAFVESDADEAGRPDQVGAMIDAVPRVGEIVVTLATDDERLTVEVADDGSGLPEGFDFDTTQSLGLSIVRDLVRTQIGGTITMRNRSGGDPGRTGTVVLIELPVREAPRAGL